MLSVELVWKAFSPNPGRLYGKVDTKLTFQELLVIGLAE